MSGEDSKRPARSNLWVSGCHAFEQQRFVSEARLRGSTFTLCVSECEKQAQVKMRFCRRNEGSYPPPDEVRQRAVRCWGSSARSGEAKQKSGGMWRPQNRRSGGRGGCTVGMFLHLYIGLDDVEKVWCIFSPQKMLFLEWFKISCWCFFNLDGLSCTLSNSGISLRLIWHLKLKVCVFLDEVMKICYCNSKEMSKSQWPNKNVTCIRLQES